jgi:SHS2 domain-containing protein
MATNDPGARQPGESGHRAAPHTADLIVEAWGPSRQRCLEEAVLGLAGTIARAGEAVPTRRRAVHLAAADDEDLLLAALQEVVYVVDVSGEVPVAAHLPVGDDGPVGGTVDGWFDLVDLADVEVIGPPPKGVARHQLAFSASEGTWTCRAVIDV